MGHIGKKDKKELAQLFKSLENQVTLVMFTQEHECDFCRMTREILEELAGLSGKISLEVHDFLKDRELAKQYQVDKVPAIALLGDRDYGIRFYGIPAGYEFTTFVEDIRDVARRDPKLSEEVAAELAKVNQPVHLQVMVSPTCPYCPTAVRAAHRFAMASDKIRADMVEVSEFPHLAVKYHVHGVPATIINEKHNLVGPRSERELAQEILRAIGGQ